MRQFTETDLAALGRRMAEAGDTSWEAACDQCLTAARGRTLCASERQFHEWCREWAGWSPETATKRLKVGRWLDQAGQEFDPKTPMNLGGAMRHLPHDTTVLCDIARIPWDRLGAFAQRYPQCFGVNSADRDDIRECVNVFLGCETKPKQQDFFRSLGLPEPMQFRERLAASGVSPELAACYAFPLVSYAVNNWSALDQESRDSFLATMGEMVLRIPGGMGELLRVTDRATRRTSAG